MKFAPGFSCTSGPDPAAVAHVVNRLGEGTSSQPNGATTPRVTHLVSIGGWGAPHPDTSLHNGAGWWAAFRQWDAAFAAKVGVAEWTGFAGVDIDTEGANNATSPYDKYSNVYP